jgi:hypothetical protein
VSTKPDPNSVAIAETIDGLNVLRLKLRALESAARDVDGSEEREGLAWLLKGAWLEVEELQDLVDGVHARLRTAGTQNGGGEGAARDDSPALSLDEEEVRELITDLYRITYASPGGLDVDEEEADRRIAAMDAKLESLADRLCEAAGIPVNDDTIQEFLDAARPWAEKAAKYGKDAVGREGVES